MGEVYLARDVRLGRKVALKVVLGDRLDAAAIESFLEEARVTARFSHPHIVAVYGAGEVDGRPYLALEYLEGGTLREQLDQARLPVGRAIRVAWAVAQALAEAHDAGVLHRDLKPENVFLPRDGRVRVVDFGLARTIGRVPDVDGAAATLDTQLAGTPLYMAPEQWRSSTTSTASDVWAFGLCLFEMLAGTHPFADGDLNIARLRGRMVDGDLELPELGEASAVSSEVRELLTRCLAVDPEGRPSARQVVQILDAVLHGRSVGDDAEEPPFRGLLPFTEEHAGEFFGREGELAGFVERLRTESTLPVVGPSGAGKSSFVGAGVLPRLREQAFWTVVQLRPGRAPFETLASRLVAKETQSMARVGVAETVDFLGTPAAPERGAPAIATSPAALAARLREHPNALHLVLSELAESSRTQLLLIVDQLEELFTLVDDDEERRAFLTALCTAADDPDEPIRVIFTVRDDFLGRLAEAPAAAEALARVALIRPLGREALLETLVRPLQARGYAFDDPSLPQEMVAEVADSPAGLPLLQFAARMLWDRRDRTARVLRRRDYEAIGGVAGALARHGEEVLAGMSEERREVARQLLLRLLTAEGTRRTVPWSEAIDGLPAAHAEAVLQRLVGSRLLVVREGMDPLVELAHESLVDTWSRLRRWHGDSREEVRLLAEIEDAARLWERRGQRLGELWSGETLMDAERAMGAVEMPLSSRARAFLDRAVESRDRVARTRRIAAYVGVALLAGIALVSTLASLEYARQRGVAVAHADEAEQARAEALAAGAHAAYASGDTLAARAQLRSSLGLRDTTAARALWLSLDDDVVAWRLDTPYWPHGYDLSADGNHLAVAASDGILRRFDLRTGAVVAYRSTSEGALAKSAISPSGDQFAAVDFDGKLWVWSGEGEGRTLDGVPDNVYPYHLQWLSEDRLLLYVYWPEGFATASLVWTGPEGAPERIDRTQGHGRMAVSPDSERLVSGNPRGGEVHLLGLTDGSKRVLGELDRDDRVGQFAFHPDGVRVAAVGRSVVIYGAGEPVRFVGHPAAVRAAGFIDGGKTLVALGADGRVLAWDVDSQRVLRDLHLPIQGDPKINGGEILPSGRMHVNRENGLMHLDLGRGGTRGVDRGHIGFVEGIASSPDGRWLASGGQDGTVRVWSSVTGEQVAVLTEAQGGIGDLRFDPRGEILAAAASSGNVVLWSVPEWTVIRVLDHPADLKGALFARGGESLLTADYGGWLREWDLSALRRDGSGADVSVKWTRRLDTNVFDIDVVPGSTRFVVSDYYGRLHTGRIGSNAELRVVEAHRRQAHTVIALADGSAFSLGFDDALRRWDLQTGALLSEITTPGASGVAVSADGAWTARGGEHGTLLEGPSGRRWLAQPPHGPSGVRFSADGQRLAVGDFAGTLWWIDVPSGRPLWRTGFAEGPRVLTHRGWSPSPPEGAWAVTLAERGWAASAVGDTLCVLTVDGEISLWDRRQDAIVASWPAPEALQVVAQPDRCLVRDPSGVRALGAGEQALPDGVLAEVGDGWAAVLGVASWWLVGPGGEVQEREGVGVTAVRRVGDRTWIGTSDGGFEAIEADGGRLRPSWVRPPASAVVALEAGPGNTVFSAHQDGQLVLWEVRSGARLLERKLHGPPVHLERVDGGLVAATAVGDVLRLDLSVFESDRCEVLQSVQAVIPTIWQGDRISLANGPAKCADVAHDGS